MNLNKFEKDDLETFCYNLTSQVAAIERTKTIIAAITESDLKDNEKAERLICSLEKAMHQIKFDEPLGSSFWWYAQCCVQRKEITPSNFASFLRFGISKKTDVIKKMLNYLNKWLRNEEKGRCFDIQFADFLLWFVKKKHTITSGMSVELLEKRMKENVTGKCHKGPDESTLRKISSLAKQFQKH